MEETGVLEKVNLSGFCYLALNQVDSGRIKPGSETVNNPDPDSFRPQNQRSRPQNPQQTRPQPLWIGVREAGPPIRVQEARRRYPRAL